MPKEEHWGKIHSIILEELSRNIVKPGSEAIFYQSIYEMIEEGAECIILGCTEIPMLVREGTIIHSNKEIPVIDSTKAHGLAAVDVYLGQKTVPSFFPSG